MRKRMSLGREGSRVSKNRIYESPTGVTGTCKEIIAASVIEGS